VCQLSLGLIFPYTFMCLFNVILCPMLGLLLIFFNELCRVMFNFPFVANTNLVVACQLYQWGQSMLK